MAIAYSWSFSALGKHDEGGFVNAVRDVAYTITATDGTTTRSVSGNVRLPPPKAGTFKLFASITKTDAINWVTGILDVPALKTGLADQVASAPAPDPLSDIVAVPPPFGVL